MDDALKFGVHPSVIFQLGESLISNPVQALLELIKNSYDADASYVKITIDTTGKSKIDNLKYPIDGGVIIIEDDGFGMNEDEFKKGWLIISNRQKMNMKKEKKTTPHGRTPLGDKGLGRLGTQRLGNNIEIFTKKEDSNYEYQFSFSWNDFKNVHSIEKVEIFQNKCETNKKQGTRIVISDLKDISIWEREGLKELETELSGIICPYEEIREFIVYVKVNGRKLDLISISDKIRDIAQLRYTIDFNGSTLNIQGKARLDFFQSDINKDQYYLYAESDNGKAFCDYLLKTNKTAAYNLKKSKEKKWFIEFSIAKQIDEIVNPEIYKKKNKIQIYNPGPFRGEVDYFDLGRSTFAEQSIFDRISEFRVKIKQLSGIKIYRNGFGIHVDEDWLGLGKQWTSAGSYYGLKPENTTGYIAITARENMQLEETTNREGFTAAPYFNNFFNLMQEFVKFSGAVQKHCRRSWNEFCKQKNKDNISYLNLGKDITAISEEIKERTRKSAIHKRSLSDIKSKLDKGNKELQIIYKKVKNSTKITQELKNEIEEALQSLKPVLEDVNNIFPKVQEHLDQIIEIEKLEQVVSDRTDTLKEQLQDMIETVALGMVAEALSHEVFNTLDLLSERTESIRQYMLKQENSDIK